MVRTELDALPMEEKTGLPYASKAKQMLRGARDAGGAQLAATTSTWPSWVGTARTTARHEGPVEAAR